MSLYIVIQNKLPEKLHKPQPLVVVEGILESPSGCYLMAEGTAIQGEVKNIVAMLLSLFLYTVTFRHTSIEEDPQEVPIHCIVTIKILALVRLNGAPKWTKL